MSAHGLSIGQRMHYCTTRTVVSTVSNKERDTFATRVEMGIIREVLNREDDTMRQGQTIRMVYKGVENNEGHRRTWLAKIKNPKKALEYIK
jgi:hypothetical protein